MTTYGEIEAGAEVAMQTAVAENAGGVIAPDQSVSDEY